MSEEERGKMDKKSNPRQCSPLQRNGADIKKDLSSRNQHWGKRRGNSSSGNFSNAEGQGKKPTPQKFKNTWDKRPRSRGEVPERTRGDLEERFEEYDYGTVFQTGSKKGSLNHLLNFSYGDAEDGYRRRGNGARGGWDRPRHVARTYQGYRGLNSRGSRIYYNKEQFLQANCQFVVKEQGDYSVHLMNPDSLVDWDAIEQVRVISSEPPSCPICLDQPVAAKMTRCGHVYCWACILHYLAVGEKTWRKCPICYESVHSDDLKSVVSHEVKSYKVGDTITMSLMRKEKGSIYAVPAHLWHGSNKKCHNVQDSDKVTRHMKLLTASPDQVLQLLDQEREQLMVQLAVSESSEEAFIKGAQQQLQAKQEAVLLFKQAKEAKVKKKRKPSKPKEEEPVVPTLKHASDKNIKIYKSAFSDEEEEVEEKQSSPTEPTAEIPSTDNSPDADAKTSPADTAVKKPATDVSTDTATKTHKIGAKSQDEGATDDINTPRSSASEEADADSPSSPHSQDEAPSTDPENLKEDAPTGPDTKDKILPVDPRDLMPDALPMEEAAEQLELPIASPMKGDSSNKTRNVSGEHSYYFYQSEDGQQIYLHSLNARCLVKEYGSFENGPQTITATIVEKESVFVSEELRKRLRYLDHLPLTCGFEVVELNIKPPVVSKEILKHFSDDIEKRRRLRQRKNRDEKKMARRIEEEERRKFGLSNSTIVPSQFGRPVQPERRPSETELRVSESRSDTSSPSLDTPIGSPGMYAAEYQPTSILGHDDDDGSQASVVSFAQMLKGSAQSTPAWPSKKKPERSPLSPHSTTSKDSDESDNEDKVPVPEYHSSFGSAIEAALVRVDNRQEESDPSKASSGSGSKSSGKKKKKQLVLFSTSMARGGGK